MQALPEVTPRKEPTEITGSLFAVVVVIPLNYPRANECSRTTRDVSTAGSIPGGISNTLSSGNILIIQFKSNFYSPTRELPYSLVAVTIISITLTIADQP